MKEAVVRSEQVFVLFHPPIRLPEGVVCSEPTNAEGVVPRSMVDTVGGS